MGDELDRGHDVRCGEALGVPRAEDRVDTRARIHDRLEDIPEQRRVGRPRPIELIDQRSIDLGDVRNTIFGDEDVPRTRIRAPRLPHDERRLFEHGGRLRGRRRLQS